MGLGKQESSGSTHTTKPDGDVNDRSHTTSRAESSQNSESSDTKETDASGTLFGRFRSSVSSASPKVSSAFQKLKDAKVVDIAKKGYDIVKDELSSNPSKRRHMRYANASSPKEPRSAKTDIVVIPTKEPIWKKKWDALKEKVSENFRSQFVEGIDNKISSVLLRYLPFVIAVFCSFPLGARSSCF